MHYFAINAYLFFVEILLLEELEGADFKDGEAFLNL